MILKFTRVTSEEHHEAAREFMAVHSWHFTLRLWTDSAYYLDMARLAEQEAKLAEEDLIYSVLEDEFLDPEPEIILEGFDSLE